MQYLKKVNIIVNINLLFIIISSFFMFYFISTSNIMFLSDLFDKLTRFEFFNQFSEIFTNANNVVLLTALIITLLYFLVSIFIHLLIKLFIKVELKKGKAIIFNSLISVFLFIINIFYIFKLSTNFFLSNIIVNNQYFLGILILFTILMLIGLFLIVYSIYKNFNDFDFSYNLVMIDSIKIVLIIILSITTLTIITSLFLYLLINYILTLVDFYSVLQIDNILNYLITNMPILNDLYNLFSETLGAVINSQINTWITNLINQFYFSSIWSVILVFLTSVTSFILIDYKDKIKQDIFVYIYFVITLLLSFILILSEAIVLGFIFGILLLIILLVQVIFFLKAKKIILK